MDINKDQQVNTFLKGMNTDLSDALIDNSQYRYAENIRVTTNTDHNTGEARLIEGNTKIAEFQGKQIVYINSIRDYVVVICAHKENNTDCWSLYVSANKGVDWTLIFGPCTDLLWSSLDSVAISGVMRFESENNIKLYLADGKHVILPIWVDKSHWPKENTPVPTEIDTLTGYQDTFLPAPVASISSSSGHLKPAKVQYIYRLYKLGGAATTLSPVGNVLSLYKNNSEGYSDKELTNKAVTVRINFDDVKSLNRIQLFRITYMYNGQMPTVQRIEDKEIDPTQSYIDIEDYGDSQEELGISELLSLTQMQIKPKIIESKGDILFAANLKYVQDDVDKMFENYDTRSFSSGNYWKLITPVAANSTTGVTPYRWDDQSGLWRELSYDTTVTEYPIQFNEGVLINPPSNAELCHRQFTNNSDYTYNQKWWRPWSEENILLVNNTGGKGTNIDWRLDEELVTVSNTEWNAEFDRAYYKCDETYRFGAVLYNDKNQASSVKWIADIRIPPRQASDYVFTSEGVCQVKMYKIKFYIKQFPEDCKAIRIVQCPRTFSDRRVITQGIVSAPMRMSKKTGQTNYICPSGIMTLQEIGTNNFNGSAGGGVDDTYVRYAYSSRDTIQFASPEYAYQADDIKNVISSYKSQISMQHVAAFTTPGTNSTYEFGTNNLVISTAVTPVPTVRASGTNSIGFRFHTVSSNNKYSFMVDRYTTVDDSRTDLTWEEEASVNRHISGTMLKKEIIDQANDDNPYTYGYTAFNRVLPNGVLSDSNAVITYPSEISAFGYPTVPAWNKFADGDKIRFMDDVTPVGTYSFINWSYPLCLDASGSSTSDFAKVMKDIGQMDSNKGRAGYFYPIGTGGKCMVIKFASNFLCGGQDTSYKMPAVSGQFAPIHVANIVKLCTPYGGYNKQAIQNSTYYSRGTMINRSDVTDGQTYEITATGGDSYVGWFKYNANHMWYDPLYVTATKMASVYEVPLDMDIDIYAQCGNPYDASNTTNGYYVQDESASIAYSGYSQEKPAYQYNTAYNQEPNIITYSSIEKTDISNYDWDVRVHNSDTKTNGESIDSWLTFKAMNYLDVDSRHGEITDLKLFKDRLIFWQNNAVGILSSNERTMLNDSDGNQIILGNGGVLQRSDYISTMYGMKPKQFVTTQSNTTLYWWDGNDKEILAYSENGILPLASLKGVRNYLNEHDENTHPCMFYDTKNKELVSSVVNNESVVYSEQIEAFSSIYKFMPLYTTTLFSDILTTTTDSIYNQKSDGLKAYLFSVAIYPKIKYVINNQNMFPKVFDIQTFGGRFYGGDDVHNLQFDYKTPLKQHSECTGTAVTNREYDFRLDIPRNNNDSYGGRMRGKTMQCELSSTSNSTDFSIQYITTKYRMSWS